MPRPEIRDNKFVYFISIPTLIRLFAVGLGIVPPIFFTALLIFKLGFGPTLASVKNDFGLWLVLAAIFLPYVALFLCLAQPPRNWLSRLEFEGKSIRLVPKPLLRWIGEPTKQIPINPCSDELILCSGSRDSIPLGFRVIVRGQNHRDLELKIESGARLTPHQAKILSDRAAAAIGISPRLIERKSDGADTLQEVPWAPEKHSSFSLASGTVVFAASPFMCGITAAALRVGWPVAVGAGLAIWLLESALLFVCAPAFGERRDFSTALWLSTLITFSATYSATFAFTSYLFGSQ